MRIRKDKIIGWVGIISGILLVLYLCVSGFGIAIGYAHMGLQSRSVNGRELGIARYNQLLATGEQCEYKIYTDEEIEDDPDLDAVRLYYFPEKMRKRTNFVLICPGGAYVDVALEEEGFSTAAKINEYGYAAFVLVYRVGVAANGRKPLDDLARALFYISYYNTRYFDDVIPHNYALCGYSAGGNLVGLFGTQEYGWDNFWGFSQPAAIIMAYPWINPDISSSWNLFDTITYKKLAERGHNAFLHDNPTKEEIETMNVANLITNTYPSTFIMHGKIDHLVPHKLNSDILVEKFKEVGVPYEYYLLKNVNHGAGICEGTNGEDWIERALEFWQLQFIFSS